MERKALDTALRHVFVDDNSSSRERSLKDLCSLLSYYADDDMSDTVKDNFHRLNAVTVKMQDTSDIWRIIPRFDNHFSCDLRNNPDSQAAQNFTFAPNITYPDIDVALQMYSDRSEKIVNELVKIDICVLLLYVKKKAIEAGDFVLT